MLRGLDVFSYRKFYGKADMQNGGDIFKSSLWEILGLKASLQAEKKVAVGVW